MGRRPPPGPVRRRGLRRSARSAASRCPCPADRRSTRCRSPSAAWSGCGSPRRAPRGTPRSRRAPGRWCTSRTRSARISRLELADGTPPGHTALLEHLGPVALEALGSFGAAARNAAATTFVPTILEAGRQDQRHPARSDRASWTFASRPASPSARSPPSPSALGEHVRMEVLASSDGVNAPLDAELLAAAQRAVRTVDPEGVVAPFAMAAGTDAQRLARAGHPRVRLHAADRAAVVRLSGELPRARRARAGRRPARRAADARGVPAGLLGAAGLRDLLEVAQVAPHGRPDPIRDRGS